MNERKLTKSELAKREDIIMKMKKNKRALTQKYGKDAEAVMYGRATKLAKKQAEAMDQDKIKELVKDALQNPKKADLNKDGKLSDYEKKRGAAIEKSMEKQDLKEFGSSDMSALLSSMHINLGYPKEFPGLSKIMDAAEDATDFYMDDFEEYSTNRDELVMSNARAYARREFPDFMAQAAKFIEPIDEMDRNDPIAMRLRADKAKRAANAGDDGNDKFFRASTANAKKLAALKDKRAEIMRDMEQEAEMEGGPIADKYGDMLNKIDKAIAKLKGHGEWGPERDTDISGEEIAKRSAMFGLEEDALKEGASTEEKRIAMRAIKSIAKYRGVSNDEARNDLIRAANEIGELKEGTELYNKDGFYFKRFYGGKENGPSLQITTNKGDFITIPGKKLGLFMSGLEKAVGEFDDMSRQLPIEKSAFQKRLDKLAAEKNINEENIGLADLEERGYEAGEKAAYTYGTLITKLQNRPDKLAFKKGFVQGVIDELGSNINEDLTEDLDLGHQDNEPHMLKADLYRIGKYAMELYQILDQFEGGSEEVDLPHWWQSKIIKSKDAIVGAKHYLDFELKEPQIDAMVDVAQDVEAINEFDDESMTAYQKAVKKVYRPKYDGSIQMPSQEEVDAFFKKIGQEDHHLANKPVFGDTEPWDGEDYSDWKNITRGYKLNEGTWSVGTSKEIKNIMGLLDVAMDIKDPQELIDFLDMHSKSMYNIVGDDVFHDDIDGAKSEAKEGNMDRAQNRLSDAYSRAAYFQEFMMDREGLKEEEVGEADKVASDIQKAMNKHKKDDAKMHQLKKARTAMNKGDLSKAKKIAARLAEKLKSN
jgi:hypothetical protein